MTPALSAQILIDVEQLLLPPSRIDQALNQTQLSHHVSFHCIDRQRRVVPIKVDGFPLQFRLGNKAAPGKGERQEHIYGDIGRRPPTQKSWVSYQTA